MKRFCSALFVFCLGCSFPPSAPAKPKATPQPKATASATPAASASSGGGSADDRAGVGKGTAGVPGGAAAAGAPASTADPAAIKVAIAGDSTAADFGPDAQIYHGWGEFVAQHFTDKVTVLDMAKKGRTARSYIEEGVWKAVLHEKPDMVLIQFGHNEFINHAKDPDLKDTVREYRRYLAAYIDTAHKAGVMPVLLTPTCQMRFEGDKPADQLGPFVEACKDVALSRAVPLIDVHAACARLYEALGPEKTRVLQSKAEDPVHFGRVGAWTIAAIIAKELTLVDRRFADASKPAEGPGEDPPARLSDSPPPDAGESAVPGRLSVRPR